MVNNYPKGEVNTKQYNIYIYIYIPFILSFIPEYGHLSLKYVGEIALARAAVTLETERIKGPSPLCLC